MISAAGMKAGGWPRFRVCPSRGLMSYTTMGDDQVETNRDKKALIAFDNKQGGTHG
jgi:hypothetical protein